MSTGPALSRNNPAIARDGRKLDKIFAAYLPVSKIRNKKQAQLERLCNRAAKGKG